MNPKIMASAWLVESAMNMRALDVLKSTEQLAQELGRVDCVFLTHIHMGHIKGLSDLEGLKFIKIPGIASCPRL
jgi:phosphoribosyl 1,2-cyclic phosphodiesterase